MKLFVVFIYLALSSSLTMAGEGFSLGESLPAALQTAWSSTFYVDGVRGRFFSTSGTAVLVKKSATGKKTKLGFITANHVLQDFCGSLGTCDGLELFKDFSIDHMTGEHKALTKQSLEIENVSVVQLSALPDLAYIEAVVPSEQAAGLEPVPLNTSCKYTPTEKYYVIGYPAVWLRNPPNVKRDHVDMISTEQWSSGFFTNYTAEAGTGETTHPELLAVTTADALPANSGGPLLDSAGNIVGIVRALNEDEDAAKANGYAYIGHEGSPENQGHSVFVPCSRLNILNTVRKKN